MARSSHLHADDLRRWLRRNDERLTASAISRVAGRGPTLDARPTATWISFTGTKARGRVVLWSSGRCQLSASSADGSVSRLATERMISSDAQLDDAVDLVVDQLNRP